MWICTELTYVVVLCHGQSQHGYGRNLSRARDADKQPEKVSKSKKFVAALQKLYNAGRLRELRVLLCGPLASADSPS